MSFPKGYGNNRMQIIEERAVGLYIHSFIYLIWFLGYSQSYFVHMKAAFIVKGGGDIIMCVRKFCLWLIASVSTYPLWDV